MTRLDILKARYEMACHNLLCYSATMLTAKQGYESDWNEATEECRILEEWIYELRLESGYDRQDEYYDSKDMTLEQWRDLCKFKDKNTALFDKRWQAAKEVIDLIAEQIDINPNTTGYFLYGLVDGASPLVQKLDGYFDRSGDKVKMKKRIAELENENNVLRSIIGK